MTEMNGKIAIVTGSSSGIGRAVAEGLARKGAAVVVHYLKDAEKAHAVVAGIEKEGGKAIALQADISKVADVRRLFAEATERLGGLDILVNCSGVDQYKPVVDVMDANLAGAYAPACPAGAGTQSCRRDRLSAVPGLQCVGGSHPSRLYGRPLLVAVRRIAAAARQRHACRAGVCRDSLLRLCLDDRAGCDRATAAPAASARLGALADAALLVPALGCRLACAVPAASRSAGLGEDRAWAGKDLALGRIGALLNGFQR